MSIPNEALQRLVQEIESQAISAQREIGVVKGAVTTKQRDIRLLDLTTSEVKQLSKDTKIYEGVGKMFVFSPTAEVEKRLLSESAELKSDISNLNKKLNYLETTYRNSLEDSQLRDPDNYESIPLAKYYRVSELKLRRITGYRPKNIRRSLDLDPMKRMYPGVLPGRSEGNIYDLTLNGVGLCTYDGPPLITL